MAKLPASITDALVAYLHAGDAPVLLRWGALALLWAVWRWG